jgi:glycerol-3-phosphate cytidylyltransferase-like family protein
MDSLNFTLDKAGSFFNRKPNPGNTKNFSGVPFLPEKGDPWPQANAKNGFLPIESSSKFISIDTSNTISKTDMTSGKLSVLNIEGSNVAGFTPIKYYRPSSIENNTNPMVNTPSIDGVSTKFKEDLDKKAYVDYGDLSYYKLNDGMSPSKSIHKDFKYSTGGIPDDRNIISPGNSDIRLNKYTGTPHDNEDPVYFAFEMILNVDNSPLLNGEVEKFLNTLSYSKDNKKADEFKSRNLGHISIINQFKRELKRYFQLNRDFTEQELREDSHIFHEPMERRYYLKGIKGVDKLIERNTAKDAESFVKYGTDLITLTFNEDVTLNMGTLATLYKELYWSRLRGKGLVPENLLRFDCRIIISEMRNFVRVANEINKGVANREAPTDNTTFSSGSENLSENGGRTLNFLRDNLSRYVYDLYECQFFFDKMSHPDSIDMTNPSKVESYDVSFSFKYSNMMFERFDHPNAKWKRLSNKYGNPLEINSDTFPEAKNVGTRYNYQVTPDTLNWFSESNRSDKSEPQPMTSGEESVEKNPDPNSIYQFNSNNQQQTIDQLNALKSNTKKQSIYEKAGKKLLDNLKDAALNEAQRQINSKFKLLNTSLDKIRNSFGIGRMKEPTNVYKQPFGQYSRFFFDVKNSLRDFGGDTLGGLIK